MSEKRHLTLRQRASVAAKRDDSNAAGRLYFEAGWLRGYAACQGDARRWRKMIEKIEADFARGLAADAKKRKRAAAR